MLRFIRIIINSKKCIVARQIEGEIVNSTFIASKFNQNIFLHQVPITLYNFSYIIRLQNLPDTQIIRLCNML